MALEAFIIKTRMGLTDEELVEQIKENRICNFSSARKRFSIRLRLIRR